MIFSKQQEIQVLFTVLCKGDWTNRDSSTNVQTVHFTSSLAFCGILWNAFETDKFYASLCDFVWESHPEFLSSMFCFPVNQYLSELVPHCFSLCSSVQHHGTRSHARVLPWHRGMGAQTWCFFRTFTCSLDFLLFLYSLHDSRMNISLSVGEALCIMCLSLWFRRAASDHFSLSLILKMALESLQWYIFVEYKIIVVIEYVFSKAYSPHRTKEYHLNFQYWEWFIRLLILT